MLKINVVIKSFLGQQFILFVIYYMNELIYVIGVVKDNKICDYFLIILLQLNFFFWYLVLKLFIKGYLFMKYLYFKMVEKLVEFVYKYYLFVLNLE